MVPDHQQRGRAADESGATERCLQRSMARRRQTDLLQDQLPCLHDRQQVPHRHPDTSGLPRECDLMGLGRTSRAAHVRPSARCQRKRAVVTLPSSDPVGRANIHDVSQGTQRVARQTPPTVRCSAWPTTAATAQSSQPSKPRTASRRDAALGLQPVGEVLGLHRSCQSMSLPMMSTAVASWSAAWR